MSPERTQRLIAEVKAWLELHGVKQKDLAKELGLSPQRLNNYLSGRRELSGEQTLHLLEVIRRKPKAGERDK